MKASKFNILGRSKEDPTKALLYNTLHDHRILFDDPELDPEIFFQKIKEKQSLTSKEEAAVSELKELGILLDDVVDEQAVFQQWYDAKIRERTDMMQVTILPTMACNLACDYCFENEVREGGVMKPEMVEKTISYLKKRVWKVRPKTLHIHFFGGEPMLQPETLKSIAREMHAFTEPLGIPLTVGMISNGVLLTPEFVADMIPYGFKWVKITFDGDREAHDRKRIFHNRAGTFDRIYDNLSRIHERFEGRLKIAIGGNFDNENYDSLFGLIDRIKASPFGEAVMIARFKPIMPVNPDIASQRQGRISSFCEVCSFNQKQIDGMMALENKLWDTGLPTEERPDMGPCEYHSRHSFTIGPEGSIFKCPAFVGLNNLRAGTVEEDEYNAQGEWQVTMRKWDDDCESCHFLPSCAGGCHYSALNKTGSLEVKNCDGPYLEQSTDAFIQRQIRILSEEGPEQEGEKIAS